MTDQWTVNTETGNNLQPVVHSDSITPTNGVKMPYDTMNEWNLFFALSLDVFSVLSTLYPITRAADDPGNELIFYSWEEKCTLQSSAQIKSPQCRSSRSIIVPHLSFISFRYSQIKLRFVECSWSLNCWVWWMFESAESCGASHRGRATCFKVNRQQWRHKSGTVSLWTYSSSSDFVFCSLFHTSNERKDRL